MRKTDYYENNLESRPLSRKHMPGLPRTQKFVVSGTSMVAMARHGLILKDNEATGARNRKVFKHLLGLRDLMGNF